MWEGRCSQTKVFYAPEMVASIYGKKIKAIIVYVDRTLDRKRRWIFVMPDFRGKFAKAR